MLQLVSAISPWIVSIAPMTVDSLTHPLSNRDSLGNVNLHPIEVSSSKPETSFDADRLGAVKAFEHSGNPLARQLEGLPGVTVLSSGAQLAKPVVNGLHSQRILILQDGVRLESQAWGSDHAPEIDPFQEGEWTLLQAAASLRHGPEALGGVLDQQSAPLLKHGHLDAHWSSVWMSNNGLIGMHLRLQGPLDRRGYLQWRWQGSNRLGGNYSVPGAFVANTGNREQSTTAELQYNHNKLLINNYLRVYSLRQGLYPGAHAENSDDLQNAIASSLPLWKGDFGYNLERPMQKVLHWQYSLRIQRAHRRGGLSSLRYGYQDNQRQEYDIRSFLPLPEMALELSTQTASYTYTKTIGKYRLENAVGLMFQQNLNQPANARQFIRNYQSLNRWAYTLLSWETSNLGKHEWALRYDQIGFTSFYRPPGTNPEDPASPDKRSFQRLSTAWTWNYQIPRTAWRMRVNAGTGWRPPSANELYANGLHQGMAALERGNLTLKPEHTWTGNIGLGWKRGPLDLESQVGLRNIQDYIFLEPQQPSAVTINGVYPQFAYVGRDAVLTHWNSSASAQMGKGWKLNLAWALIRGRENPQGTWLVWMPADRWLLGLHRNPTSNTNDALGSQTKNQFNYGIEIQHVSRQSRIPLSEDRQTNLDYAPAPAAYTLLRIYLGGQLMRQHLQWMISLDNALNTRYRDYMNRLRYFADEPGRNLSLRLQYHLHRHKTI